ncbi:MAG: DUF2304 domain-containing protein [Lachnospiraceae bacterium]|nr:DUF2304 domain-containing protein [Lachnospiraceae bacterium]
MLAIRLFLIIVGVSFLVLTLLSYVKKKISPGMGVLWVLASFVLFIMGFLPVWATWMRMVSLPVTIMVFILGLAFLIGLFLVCLSVSNLQSRNRELAMQVSLLNQENEMILKELGKLEGKSTK